MTELIGAGIHVHGTIRLRRCRFTCRGTATPLLAYRPALMALRCHPGAMQRDSAGYQGVPRLSTSARTKLLVSFGACLLYTSDAADDLLCVDLGGRRIIKKKKKK